MVSAVAALIERDPAAAHSEVSLAGWREVARLGDVVALQHKPAGVGGSGFRMLRYRLVRLDQAGAWVYGPLVHDPDDGWVPMPGRVVRDYRVPVHTIIGDTA